MVVCDLSNQPFPDVIKLHRIADVTLLSPPLSSYESKVSLSLKLCILTFPNEVHRKTYHWQAVAQVSPETITD